MTGEHRWGLILSRHKFRTTKVHKIFFLERSHLCTESRFLFTSLICHILFANENCQGFDKHKFMHIDEKDSFAIYILTEDSRKMKVVKGTQEVITRRFINLKIFCFRVRSEQDNFWRQSFQGLFWRFLGMKFQ